MKILLVGNPNVGKSVVFNRLTGVDVISSNYSGTTIDYTKGYLTIKGIRHELIDVPGTYTLEPTCKAELIAVKLLKEGDIIINVIDATNLERSLNLTLQLIKQQKPIIIALNLFDEAKHTGISIDVKQLEKIIDIVCIPTCALSGEGISQLVDNIPNTRISDFIFENTERWNVIGSIINKVQIVQHKHPTFAEKLRDASIKPISGIPILLMVLALMFLSIRIIGENLIKYAMEPFFEFIWSPVILKLSALLSGYEFMHDLVVGKLMNGQINYGESFGLLTTGLYVPLGIVLPYVFAFYTFLALLEDTGYLPRVAVMVDNLMHKIGLHGLSIIPMFLGFGCNVPGALATRILETRKEKFITATLMSIAVPCMALQAMIFGLLGKYGITGLGIVFCTLLCVWFIIGFILRKIIKGTSPEIFIEIPPYRIPYFKGLVKKVFIRMKWFVSEAIPYVLIGVLIANLLYNLGVIQFISAYTAPVLINILGLPKEAIGALTIGFLRKDLAVGMLIPLDLNIRQLIVASVVLTMYFPCVATFAVLLKELGIRDMIKSTIIMIVSSILVGGMLNQLLLLFL